MRRIHLAWLTGYRSHLQAPPQLTHYCNILYLICLICDNMFWIGIYPKAIVFRVSLKLCDICIAHISCHTHVTKYQIPGPFWREKQKTTLKKLLLCSRLWNKETHTYPVPMLPRKETDPLNESSKTPENSHSSWQQCKVLLHKKKYELASVI